MNRQSIRAGVIAMTMAAGFGTGLTPAVAQVAVYDPANYFQNVLSATRALQQINNQIKALQNEAVMLQNMARHLKKLDISELARLNADIAAISDLMTTAKGIAFTLKETEQALTSQFPGTYGGDVNIKTLLGSAQTRWSSAMSAYQQTLRVQARVNEALQSDADTLNTLVRASEASGGDLEAQQAANQLLALTAKQQMQIQTLLTAQYRADAIAQARAAEAEAVSKAMTAKFLGTGKAYTE